MALKRLKKLRQGSVPKPYIILLDLQMPRMTGLEFLSELRADEAIADSIVFVLTTSKSDKDMVASYKKHVAGYFLKEGAGVQFLDVVKTLESYWRVVHFPE